MAPTGRLLRPSRLLRRQVRLARHLRRHVRTSQGRRPPPHRPHGICRQPHRRVAGRHQRPAGWVDTRRGGGRRSSRSSCCSTSSGSLSARAGKIRRPRSAGRDRVARTGGPRQGWPSWISCCRACGRHESAGPGHRRRRLRSFLLLGNGRLTSAVATGLDLGFDAIRVAETAPGSIARFIEAGREALRHRTGPNRGSASRRTRPPIGSLRKLPASRVARRGLVLQPDFVILGVAVADVTRPPLDDPQLCGLQTILRWPRARA
jgi:hypothetical protein